MCDQRERVRVDSGPWANPVHFELEMDRAQLKKISIGNFSAHPYLIRELGGFNSWVGGSAYQPTKFK